MELITKLKRKYRAWSIFCNSINRFNLSIFLWPESWSSWRAINDGHCFGLLEIKKIKFGSRFPPYLFHRFIICWNSWWIFSNFRGRYVFDIRPYLLAESRGIILLSVVWLRLWSADDISEIVVMIWALILTTWRITLIHQRGRLKKTGKPVKTQTTIYWFLLPKSSLLNEVLSRCDTHNISNLLRDFMTLR
mgnify:CR=1 FL=1